MEKSKLLREIATAMVEFKIKKELSPPLIGSNVTIIYTPPFNHPKSRRNISILSESAIDDLTQNLLDVVFELTITIPVNQELYELFYEHHCSSNTISHDVFSTGSEFLEKVEILMQTTNINASNATKMLLETMHAESVTQAIETLTKIKRYADANRNQ